MQKAVGKHTAAHYGLLALGGGGFTGSQIGSARGSARGAVRNAPRIACNYVVPLGTQLDLHAN